MSTLNITAEELRKLIDMKDQGKISEAWNFLGSKGDAYAYLAGAIVADNTASMSPLARLFYEMVRSQWDNTGAGGPDGAWGGTVFKGVGQKHLENYLTLFGDGKHGDSGAYVLPTTIEIETSYRQALTQWGLPPITAIDSLFSVIDLALGNGNRQLPQDFSWAEFMDIANGMMGGPRWQSDRIEFNSEVFKDDVTSVDAAVTFGRTLVDSLERFGAGAVAAISPFAPAYWAFKAVDGALDYTMVDFARRNAAHVAFQKMDAALSPETIDALLDAADNDDRRGFGTALDFLAKALGIPLADSNASRAQIFDNVKALSDWRDKNPQTLDIKLIELSSAGTQAQRADADGLAYRYALANLQPFAVVGADYSARNTKGELDLYNPVAGTGQITDQWIADRTAMLAHVIQANAQDVEIPSSIPGATGMHYEDVASGKKIDIGLPDNVVEKRQTVFGDGKSNVLTGKKLQDHLYGGAGADMLEGKDSADYLEGGADADTYLLQTGLTGIDTLVDSGSNTIQVDGQTVSGAFAQVAGMGGDIYYSADKSYQLRKAEDGVWRLSAKNAGTGQYSALADLKGWQDGDYGLSIGAPTQEPERIAPVVYPNSNAYLAMDGSGAPKGVVFGGGSKSDSFTGSAHDDVITTGGGSGNYVSAYAGDDMVVGGDGRDFLRTGQNSSSPTYQDNDIAFGAENRDVLMGGAGDDQLWGEYIDSAREAAGADSGEYGDWVSGELGNDTLSGSRKGDVLFGGAGQDIAKGGAGDDLILGDGHYTPFSKAQALPYSSSTTQSFVWDDARQDMVKASPSNYGMNPVIVASGQAYNWSWSRSGQDDFALTAPVGLITNLRVADGGGADTLYGGAGADWMAGQTGGDTLFGGAGDDTLYGDDLGMADADAGQDLLYGDAGNDTLYGGTKEDVLDGGQGDDKLYGEAGNDFLLGQDGSDELSGGEGADTLDGGAGADRLLGGDGNDQLWGAEGDDTLEGGAGADHLHGGAGKDQLLGGAGDDTYLFDAGDDAGVVSNATDNEGNNTVQLSGGALADMELTGSDSAWLLRYSTQDAVQLDGSFSVQWGGRTYTAAQFAQAIADARQGGTPPTQPDNHAPALAQPLPDLRTEEDQAWNYTVPASTFTDADAGDQLTYSAGLAGGAPLPSWLSFDAASSTFSGTPPDAQALQLELVATDRSGARATAPLSLIVTTTTPPTNEITGTAADEVLEGTAGADTIRAGAGDDTLRSLAGDDVLDGGAGDDILSGGLGSNTYLFGRGDGQDRITFLYDTNPDKRNTLQLKQGVSASDVTLRRDGANLVVGIAGTQDQVLVENFLYLDDNANVWNPMQQIRFDDGSAWGLSDIVDRLLQGSPGVDDLRGTAGGDVMDGAAGNDTVNGGAGHDRLLGGAGDDALLGELGDDVLDGGAGNDILSGGLGDNTYLFGRGDGQDSITFLYDTNPDKRNTLQLKQGVSASDVTLRRDGANLVVGITGTQDQVLVENFLYLDDSANVWNPVQQIRFDDGTAWGLSDIVDRLLQGSPGVDDLRGTAGGDVMDGAAGNDTVNGGAGHDRLLGGAGDDALLGELGDDVLDGGAGNDVLSGGLGDNTYLFGRGDGQDRITFLYDTNPDKLNTLQFRQGLSASDITLSREGADLVVGIAGTQDHMRVENFLYLDDSANVWNPVQQIRFDDGSTLSRQSIVGQLSASTAATQQQAQQLVQAMAAFAPAGAALTGGFGAMEPFTTKPLYLGVDAR